jgi:hypothetical protein
MREPAVEENAQILSADKSIVTSAGHADSYIVSSRSRRPIELTDSTLYYVPAAAGGLQVSGAWSALQDALEGLFAAYPRRPGSGSYVHFARNRLQSARCGYSARAASDRHS